MPSEAKTLVPFEVKRDLRRPPSFCRKFQRNIGSNQCKCKVNTKPDLILRGKEITETSSNLCSLPSNQDNDEIPGNEDKASDECMACTACMIEIEGKTPSLMPCVDETAQCVGYDKYNMDAYGNLKKNLEYIPCTEDVDAENDDSLELAESVKSRPCSPDTSRIIRITLNNKSSNDGNKQSDEDRIVVPRDIRSALL